MADESTTTPTLNSADTLGDEDDAVSPSNLTTELDLD